MALLLLVLEKTPMANSFEAGASIGMGYPAMSHNAIADCLIDTNMISYSSGHVTSRLVLIATSWGIFGMLRVKSLMRAA